MNIDQRVRLMIGDLMVNNASLMMQLEGCQNEIAVLSKELGELKSATAPSARPSRKK